MQRVLVITADTLGRGDDELGSRPMVQAARVVTV
jgi:hypothetical protein